MFVFVYPSLDALNGIPVELSFANLGLHFLIFGVNQVQTWFIKCGVVIFKLVQTNPNLLNRIGTARRGIPNWLTADLT